MGSLWLTVRIYLIAHYIADALRPLKTLFNLKGCFNSWALFYKASISWTVIVGSFSSSRCPFLSLWSRLVFNLLLKFKWRWRVNLRPPEHNHQLLLASPVRSLNTERVSPCTCFIKPHTQLHTENSGVVFVLQSWSIKLFIK